MTGLVDSFGRTHRDLRISLTDRCSLRCSYCMPAEGNEWLARDSILSTDEIVRVAMACAKLGVTSVRLTGGEPLLRADVVDVVQRLSAIGFEDVAMTTNALRLPQLAADLKAAGLRRVNISLDTLDRQRFIRLTGRDRLAETLAGIDAAIDAGFAPLKLNTVAIRDVNDDELTDLVQFAADRGAQLRFIEQMPLDVGHTWSPGSMLAAAEILAIIGEKFELTHAEVSSPDDPGSDPARIWLVDGGPGTVGVIASVTMPFCGSCDRIRLTADGQLRNCLFARDESDLLPVLRGGGTEDDLTRAIRNCVAAKWEGHSIGSAQFIQPGRGMNAIGG